MATGVEQTSKVSVKRNKERGRLRPHSSSDSSTTSALITKLRWEESIVACEKAFMGVIMC